MPIVARPPSPTQISPSPVTTRTSGPRPGGPKDRIAAGRPRRRRRNMGPPLAGCPAEVRGVYRAGGGLLGGGRAGDCWSREGCSFPPPLGPDHPLRRERGGREPAV